MPSPIRILAVDVGTGTQDILLFESGKTIENCFKMVMPSPTVIIAERIKRATEQGQPLLLTGVTMGGGPCHWAARDHALAGFAVAVTPEAGRTFDDDLAMVERMGFEVIDEDVAARRAADPALVQIELQDFNAHAIISALQAFDVNPRIDALAIAAFDHGAAPPGISDQRFCLCSGTYACRSDTPARNCYECEPLYRTERLNSWHSPAIDGYRLGGGTRFVRGSAGAQSTE